MKAHFKRMEKKLIDVKKIMSASGVVMSEENRQKNGILNKYCLGN